MEETPSTEQNESVENEPAAVVTDVDASGAQNVDTESATADLLPEEDETPKPAKSLRATLRDAYKEQVAKNKAAPEPIEQPAPPQAKALVPPASWDAESKQEFAKLPYKIQETIAKRAMESERAINQKMQELGEHEKYLSSTAEMAQAIAPYREQLDLDGITPGQAITQLFALQNLLDKDPEAGLREIASRYNFDLSQLGRPKQGQPQLHPVIREMREEQARLRAELDARNQEAERQKLSNYEAEVHSFANAKDANGQPLRPYVDDVVYDMPPIVGALLAQKPTAHPQEILQEAYDRAVWSNPATREKVKKLELQQEEAKRIAKENERAQAAKRASKSITGAPGAISAARPAMSVRDTIKAAMNGTLDS